MELERVALSDPYFIERKLYRMWILFWHRARQMAFTSNMFTVILRWHVSIGWISHGTK